MPETTENDADAPLKSNVVTRTDYPARFWIALIFLWKCRGFRLKIFMNRPKLRIMAKLTKKSLELASFKPNVLATRSNSTPICLPVMSRHGVACPDNSLLCSGKPQNAWGFPPAALIVSSKWHAPWRTWRGSNGLKKRNYWRRCSIDQKVSTPNYYQ